MAEGNTCRIKNCKNILTKTSGQICQMHRSRWFRNKSYNIPDTSNRHRYYKPAITKLGYVRVNINGKRVLEHTFIMEQHLGRKLKPQERVHHINHDKTDNRIENLELFSNNGEHIRKRHADEWRYQIRGHDYTPELIGKIFQAINSPSTPSRDCVCGNKFMAKNLCQKHYTWARSHKLI